MRVSGFFSERVKYQIQQLQWKYSHTTEEEMVGGRQEELERLIRDAGGEPCLVDSSYQQTAVTS